jgi:drug/metabolite transporter (DMT)-like permease
MNVPSRRPAAWTVVLAFTLVYLSWGTTYLAIKKGVKDEGLPPALFAGSRVCLAGCLLLGLLALGRQPIRLPRGDWPSVVLSGCLLFVGGNGLITLAEKTVPSGMAAILVATTPLWIALLESAWPGGERVRQRGWLGLALGLAGVLVLLAPRLGDGPDGLLQEIGPVFVLTSALCWSLGSVVLRYHGVRGPHLAAAAYQMVIGGGSLALLGLALGEAERLPARVTPGAVGAFVYLLVVGSLIGFVAFNWLLGHVSAARVGTYAYVNPVVAVLVGCLLDGEELTSAMVAGIAVILAGVALVRGRSRPGRRGAARVEPASTADPRAANGEVAGPHLARDGARP